MMKCVFAVTGLLAASAIVLALGSAGTTGAEEKKDQDIVEFVSGATLRGHVKAIRKADKEFDFEVTIGKRTLLRTYRFSQIHAVTMGGKRYVLTPRADASSATGPGHAGADAPRRTPAEVIELINRVGSTPPPWFDSTPLDYPRTLDLSWPLKPPGNGWNNQKNVGQYLWDIINPNPQRWRSGIKFVHHCLKLHQSDPARLQRDMRQLGRMYFVLVQDYPRAAFWMRQANVSLANGPGLLLAECYWRLGSRKMALDMLHGKAMPLGAIKLLGDMGELEAALKLTRAYSRTSVRNRAFLLAADALRRAGRLQEAIRYYQRVIDGTEFRNKDYERRFKDRARESITAIRLNDRADPHKTADGDYTGSSLAYNGKLEVRVRVADGRIKSVTVTSHKEKQFYAALIDTPNQIIRKQSVKDIDATSGATITSQAIVNATAKALAKGAQ